MAEVIVATSDPNYPRLSELKDAGIDGDVWLPEDADPEADTVLRYVIRGGMIYWIPDITYTSA
jgi:hypothetical protein